MKPRLHVLMIEDSEDDAFLIERELRRSGYDLDCDRVETQAAMQAVLDEQPWDLVIADYTLPGFSAPEALELLQSQQKDLPFIIVSGTIGEETAVAAMKAGAHDYIVKGNLARLVPAVERELREAEERKKRNQAEQALKESEERFRQLAENITESVFWMSEPKTARLLYVSPSYERIWGRSCESLYGNFREWLEAIHPEDRQRIQNAFFEQALLGNYDEEYRIVRPDGSLRWIRDRGFPIVNDRGEPYRVVGIAEDITERKHAGLALQESEQKLSLFVRYAPVSVAMFDLNMRYIAASQRWVDNYNLGSIEAILERSHYEIFPQIPDRWRQVHQRGLAGESYKCKLDEWVLANGAQQFLRWEVQPWHNRLGEVGGILIFIEDITDRVHSERSLQESEERLRLATEAADLGMWFWDLTLDELTWTTRCKTLFGLAPNTEMSYSQFLDALHSDDRDRTQVAVMRAIQDKVEYNIEYRVVYPDGTAHWIAAKGKAFYNDYGEPIRMMGTAQDISDRKNAEAELQQAHQDLQSVNDRLGGIIEGTHDLIAALDLEFRFIAFNSAYKQEFQGIFGKTIEIGTSLSDALAQLPQEQTKAVAIWGRALRGEEFSVIEEFGNKQLGQRCYEITYSSIRDANNRLLGASQLARDITDRLQAEQKIHEQAALLDVATDAILVRDLEHQILFWNKGAERLYRWQAEEVLGKNAIDLLYKPGETLPKFAAIQTKLIEEGQWQGEFNHITKNGETIVVESRWTLVCDEAGLPKSILTVSTDITEKKQLEAQFLRAQRLESLGTLASGIAHDFNNILTPILAVAQLLPLKFSHLDEQSQQLLKLVEDSAKRGANLVKQILAFARGVEGKRVPLQVRHLLSEVVQVAKQTFPKAIELYTDIPTTDLWTVSADVTQLHQVLMNLCVNARDAMPDGGTFSLAAENLLVDEAYSRMNLEARVGPYVAITISDTGVGIPPELLERIFDPFFTTKEPGKGTGLGLSTVLGIVKNHGGFVKVYSEVEQGSQFKVYLPAIEDAALQTVEELELLTGRGELILIVDDEPLIQQVTKTSLEERNYKTLVANDGIEAIALYAQHKQEICAVLMDIMMPSMDGLTAIRALQKMNSQVKVIATSGLASNHQLAEATGIGVKAFLPKPYTATELLDALQKILNTDKS